MSTNDPSGSVRPTTDSLQPMQRQTVLSAAAAAAAAGAAGLVVAAGRSRPATPVAPKADPPTPLPPGRVVAVPGHGELFFRDTGPGPGPTILLLHGWLVTADLNWFTCYEPLARSGRVVALDHRGHGRGPRPSAPFRLADAADDAAALVDHLDLGPVVAVGYSMGGPIAQRLWQRHPATVGGLVLGATAATFSGTRWERVLWKGMGALQVALRMLPRLWWEAAVRAQLEGRLPLDLTRIVGPDTGAVLRQALGWAFGEVARGNAEDQAEAGRELGRYDARGWLPSVDVPTAVVMTLRDRIVPLARQRELAARLPGARVFEVDLDHDAPTQAAIFPPVLVAAVDDVAARAGLGGDAARQPHDPASWP